MERFIKEKVQYFYMTHETHFSGQKITVHHGTKNITDILASNSVLSPAKLNQESCAEEDYKMSASQMAKETIERKETHLHEPKFAELFVRAKTEEDYAFLGKKFRVINLLSDFARTYKRSFEAVHVWTTKDIFESRDIYAGKKPSDESAILTFDVPLEVLNIPLMVKWDGYDHVAIRGKIPLTYLTELRVKKEKIEDIKSILDKVNVFPVLKSIDDL